MKNAISKILIANRGEVTSRIARTVRKMGLLSVAIYTESDAGGIWIESADESVLLSGAGYLDQESIIEAAQKVGANAIHPGFGFLSENPDFARNVRKNGLIFIGPPENAIRDMGNKLRAKELAKKAGVITIPGVNKPVAKLTQALRVANEIGGYPVIIKAAAGGGGKGIRVVFSDAELADAFHLTTAEAKSSFGDSSVFIEKYIVDPRHIEIQIIADKHGNVISLGERECSIQRRYQKIIEETPSPCMTESMREAMSKQSVALAQSIGYYSVGTVEFVANNSGEFFFLEMNTRLQVEHTVTEMVTDLDLVELMINIEEGYPLDFKPNDIKFNGHAMELRIYAEDPENDFAPSVDRITSYLEPLEMDNLRIESGVGEGSKINPNYDPMIVKLCAWGNDRKEAINNISRALSQFVINGQHLTTNMIFLEYIMTNAKFLSGDISTNFVKNECSIGKYSHPPAQELNFMMTALAFLHFSTENCKDKLIIKFGDNYFKVHITKDSHDNYNIAIDNGFALERISAQNVANILVVLRTSGEVLYIKVTKPTQYVSNMIYYASFRGYYIRCRIFEEHVGQLFKLMPATKILQDDPRNVVSQMSGKVVNVFVQSKDHVKKGERLICVEAMKMQNIIYAKSNATVEDIYVKTGDLVNKGDILMSLLPD